MHVFSLAVSAELHARLAPQCGARLRAPTGPLLIAPCTSRARSCRALTPEAGLQPALHLLRQVAHPGGAHHAEVLDRKAALAGRPHVKRKAPVRVAGAGAVGGHKGAPNVRQLFAFAHACLWGPEVGLGWRG